MTLTLQQTIDAAQRLSSQEKHRLIEAIVQSLVQADSLEMRSAEFHRTHTLDQLIANQKIKPFTSLAAVAADFWPEEESADDFTTYIDAQRRLDRENR